MVEQEVVDCLNDIIIIVEKKEKRRLSQKKYRDNNKEKIKNKEKEYRENNKEKIKGYQKEYRDDNKEKKKESYRLWSQTDTGIKSKRIGTWKHSGIICEDFDELYNHYLRTSYCDICKVELTYDKRITCSTKCLDHCHESGQVRNILCHSCNTKRGQNNF